MIILVTILVGGLIFVQGQPKTTSEATPVPTVSERDAAAAPTTPPPAPAGPQVPPAELAVLVGNAVDPRKPIASTVASRLSEAGFTSVRRVDVTEKQSRSAVYYVSSEWREDAKAVAEALGIPEADVGPLPDPAPATSPDSSAFGSKVYVIVGQEPQELSGTASGSISPG